jgi:hydroxymethylglutaryl-CoA reductase (NADPH)
MFIPKLMLQQLYTIGSLRLNKGGIQFSLKNRLRDASLCKIKTLKINKQLIDAESIYVSTNDGEQKSVADIEQSSGL